MISYSLVSLLNLCYIGITQRLWYSHQMSILSYKQHYNLFRLLSHIFLKIKENLVPTPIFLNRLKLQISLGYLAYLKEISLRVIFLENVKASYLFFLGNDISENNEAFDKILLDFY